MQNVNGLNSRNKRWAVFMRLKRLHPRPDIALLIETHCGSDEQALGWVQEGSGAGQPWMGPSYWHHGSRQSRGVAVLFREGLSINAPKVCFKDPDGRVLAVSFSSLEGHQWVVMAVYAPVERDRRARFFSGALHRACAACPPGASLLIAGDWNCVVSQLDLCTEGNPSHSTRLVGAAQLQQVQQHFGLLDAWRALHPQVIEFTKTTKNGRSITSGRTTRWLVSEDLLPLGWVAASQHLTAALQGDHDAGCLQLQPPTAPLIGPYGWVFPTYLLSLPEFVEVMRAKIDSYFFSPPAGLSPPALWEDAKRVMKLTAIQFHKWRVVEQRKPRAALVRAVAVAKRCAQQRPHSVVLSDALHAATQALQQFDRQEAAARALPLDALWGDFGEQSTAWFHRLGSTAVDRQPIRSIKDPGGGPSAVLTTPAGVKQAGVLLADFYDGARPAGLFHPVVVDPQAQQLLLGALDATLDAAGHAACLGPTADGRLTVDCVKAALAEAPCGKQPGCDGFPYEFYSAFWPQLGSHMVRAFNHLFLSAEADPAMPGTSRSGIIIPIFKGDDKPADDPDSYRPITLLNTDVKLVAKVLAMRMGTPLDSVLDATQTAFVPGRWIGDNVLFHLEEVDYLTASQQPACILGLDFNKAYDRVDRGWLFQCMAALGIPDACCRWVKLLLQGSQAWICFNGWQSRVFAVPSGCAQGSPLSPLLYVISAQPLSARFRQLQSQGLMPGIPLPDGSMAPPLQTHADDTSLHAAGVAAAVVGLDMAIAPHEAASGGRLNRPKSWGLTLGGHAPIVGRHAGTGITFKGPLDVTRHLGIPLTTGSQDAAVRDLYARKLRAICARARHWSQYELSMLGRIHVAKQVLASVLSYHATFLAPPGDLLESMQKVISGYILRGQLVEEQDTRPLRGRPARQVARLPVDLGGLGQVDLEAHITGLQAKVAAQLLHPRPAAWKPLMAAAFERAFPGLGTAVLVQQMKCSGAANLQRLSPRHQRYVEAFRQVGVHRTLAHTAMSQEQVGLEPLVGNHSVAKADGMASTSPSQLPAPLQTVQQLRQVPKEHLGLLKLPPAWGPALGFGPSTCAWQMGRQAAADTWVRHAHPARGWEVFKVGPDGRLVPPPAQTQAPQLEWTPACVVECAVADPHGAERARLLVGAWDQVRVDPSVWGLGSVPLLEYTVKHGTSRIILSKAAKAPGWVPGAGLRPKLWGAGGTGPADPNTISSMARGQKRRYADSVAAPPPARRAFDAEELAPLYHAVWFDPSPARLHVRQRVHDRAGVLTAQRAAQDAAYAAIAAPLVDDCVDPIGSIQGMAAWRGAWRRAQHKLLPRPSRLFAWRLLHGALPCGGATVQLYPAGHADLEYTLCRAPTCQGTPRPLETLQHLFLECPVGSGAMRWLCALWERLQPPPHPPPPFTAAVLLADDPSSWKPRAGSLRPVWNLLRVTMLKQVWAARQRAAQEEDGGVFTVEKIVAAFVLEVRGLIWQDWLRAQGNLRALSGVGPAWLRGRQIGLQLPVFKRRWCVRGILASVSVGATPSLSVHLSSISAPFGP